MRTWMPAKTLFASVGWTETRCATLGHRSGHEVRLALGHREDDAVGEVRAEHLGLQLEQPVEEPDEAEPDLDRPCGHPPRCRCPHGRVVEAAAHAVPRMIGTSSARVRSAWNWWFAASEGSVHTWSMK